MDSVVEHSLLVGQSRRFPWTAGRARPAWTFAMALLALGELRRMEQILDVSRDDMGLMLDVDSLPKRSRRPGTRPR